MTQEIFTKRLRKVGVYIVHEVNGALKFLRTLRITEEQLILTGEVNEKCIYLYLVCVIREE